MKDFSRFEMVGLTKDKMKEIMAYLGEYEDIRLPRDRSHNEEILFSIKALIRAKENLKLTDQQLGMLIWDAAEIITIHKLDHDDFEGLNINSNDLR